MVKCDVRLLRIYLASLHFVFTLFGVSCRNNIFQYTMVVVGVKSNLGGEAGCGLTVSCSERSRIGRTL